MPFSLAQEVMGYWVFGDFWCQAHSALDVLLCTASILNITLISLDRYWSITRAVDYIKFRTETSVSVMICVVWMLSFFVSVPPLFYGPWQKPFEPLTAEEVYFTEEEDAVGLAKTVANATDNVTVVFAHAKCGVSKQLACIGDQNRQFMYYLSRTRTVLIFSLFFFCLADNRKSLRG